MQPEILRYQITRAMLIMFWKLASAHIDEAQRTNATGSKIDERFGQRINFDFISLPLCRMLSR